MRKVTPRIVGTKTTRANSRMMETRGTSSCIPVSHRKRSGTTKGEKAVLTALKTAAKATFPRAISTKRGEDTSVGSVPSRVWPVESNPFPKKGDQSRSLQLNRAIDEPHCQKLS